jgi:hypothetical protein
MNHAAGTGGGGTAIIIKNCIEQNQLNGCSQDFFQATSVAVAESDFS